MSVNTRFRVLVTGASGLVGRHLVERLLQEQCQVWVMLRTPVQWPTRLAAYQTQLQAVRADLTEAAAVAAAVQTAAPELVFHLASTPFNPPPDPPMHYQVNVLGTLNLLEALRPFPQARIVYTSSAAEYGSGAQLTENSPLQPATLLGASKAAATLLLQAYARQSPARSCVILRVFTPYGPWESAHRLIPYTILSALNGQEVRMTAGTQERDFVYIADLIEALWRSAQAPVLPGTVFNLGSGCGRPVREVAATVLRLMGNPVNLQLGSRATRVDEIQRMSADIQAARIELGWQPRTALEEGLTRTIAWVTANRALAAQLT